MSEELPEPFELLHQQVEESKNKKGRFESGEHQWLGMRGAEAACKGDTAKFKMLCELPRLNDKRPITYGEIVALSGDFYGSAEELFQEKPARVSWWKGSNDLEELRKQFATELNWMADAKRHEKAGYPNNTLSFAWIAKSYLELAEDNVPHFGWHNIKRYCESHTTALEYASKAGAPTVDDENWLRAVFHNGFADHFLTDGFAAGHIRVPRQQIIEWAKGQNYSSKLAGLLSKVLHDQDGHVKHMHASGEKPLEASEGLLVKNSIPKEWRTRCDGQLFLVPKADNQELIAEPVAAVAASLGELFTAQITKKVATGVFTALEHVPFPHPDEPPLAKKFEDTSAERIEDLLESFDWYLQLSIIKPFTDAVLNAKNITALFKALPLLMDNFRKSVQADCDAHPELLERLPKPYVEAFKRIA